MGGAPGGWGGMFFRRCVDGVIVEKVELCRKWLVGRIAIDQLLAIKHQLYK